MNLAALALDESDAARGHPLLREGAACYFALGRPALVPVLLDGFAKLAALEGQPSRALRLASAGAAQRVQLGIGYGVQAEAELLRHLAPARRALEQAADDAPWAEGQALTREQALASGLNQPTGNESDATRS